MILVFDLILQLLLLHLNGWSSFIKTSKGASRVIPFFIYLAMLQAVQFLTFDIVLFSASSALRRSRRRVRAVINTELPYLMSKEFSNIQEKDSSVMNTTTGIPHSIIAEMHRTRWTSLFDQMDEALAEEEKQLVSTQKIDNISFY